TNTGNLTKTFMRLPGKFLCVPAGSYTFHTLSFCNTNNVNHFILSKDFSNWNLLLEMSNGKVNLISNGSTIQLDLHDVCLLDAFTQELDLGVGNNPHNTAILLNFGKVSFNLFLAYVISPLFGCIGESPLLRLVPVGVKC
ncbi:unnamed protein product, partial [Meganyctiphanes norvegica]